jgi:hypothetical protein
MSTMIQVEKSKPSSLKRLKFLPRFGLVVDFAGREFIYRQAPILETLLNLSVRGLSAKSFMEVAMQQLSEIGLSKQPLKKSRSTKKKSQKKTQKKNQKRRAKK